MRPWKRRRYRVSAIKRGRRMFCRMRQFCSLIPSVAGSGHTLAKATKPPAILEPSLLLVEVVVTGAGGVSPAEIVLGIERRKDDSKSIVTPP